MPIDWSEWPSPSAPDVVRARIRARAKTLIRRRLAAAATALCTVVVVVAVPRLDGTESTQRVQFADEPGGGEAEAVGQDAGPGADDAFSADGEGPVTVAPEGGRPSTLGGSRTGSGPGTPPAGSNQPAPAPSPSDGSRPPLMTDPAGDAGADGAPSIDLVAGSVRMEGGVLVAAAAVVDLESGPQRTDDDAEDVERWTAYFGYADGAFSFVCERMIATGASSCRGWFSRGHDVDEGAGSHVEDVPMAASLGGAGGAGAGDAVVFRVRVEDMNAALARDPRRDYAPLRTGTSLTVAFEAVVARSAVVAAAYTGKDAMGTNTRYRLGD